MKKELLTLSTCMLFLTISFIGCMEETDNETPTEENNIFSQYDEFCFTPFCNLTPKIYNFSISNNPSEYMGDRIAYEEYSDWKNYTPLIQQVNNITVEESSDYDKFIAIARYVKQSKEYGEPSPANEFKTVIDIYESPTGVCLDASILLAAMLRIEGIPAKSVTSATLFHQFNEVYVNNTWIVVDATFGNGEPYIGLDNLPYLVNFVFKYNGTFHDVIDHRKLLFEEVHLFNRFYYSSDAIKSKYGQGTIVFPVVSKTVYVPISSNLSYDKSNLSFEKEDGSYETWFRPGSFDIMDNLTIEYNKKLGQISIYYWTILNNTPWAGNTRYTGYIKTLLPAFNYRMYYEFSGDTKVAYVDFEIRDGETTVIKPEDMKRVSNASKNNFNVFMALINELPSYESLLDV